MSAALLILSCFLCLIPAGSVSAGIIPSQFLASRWLIKFMVYIDTNLCIKLFFRRTFSVLFRTSFLSPSLSLPLFAMWINGIFHIFSLGSFLLNNFFSSAHLTSLTFYCKQSGETKSFLQHLALKSLQLKYPVSLITRSTLYKTLEHSSVKFFTAL